ncbi:MAG TPA: nitrite/sulfite reductase [Anaeromyxobacteraceae bacterium]|nr:nitrite/sulfite reductase [Anaeromyxobacteraceae bacterium]
MSPESSGPRGRTTFAEEREIDALIETLGRYERGEIDAEAWRAYRVVRGVYSQRQDGVHMLRIKVPQGVATATQLRALADAATRWSRGFGHITTRQNFQLHFVRPADLDAALRRLAEAGITTAGAGGNAVRNVVACPFAGVSADEVFDVTPYAEAVTRHFLRHPLALALPRKFKIAFEGCGSDHVATPIQDLGLRARVDDHGHRGFEVTVAGGTASLCTSAEPLVEFLPAADVLAVAEAVVRVFHARGDRQNKQRNRLKFLVRQLGFDEFRALFEEQLAAVHREGAPRLPFDPQRPPEELAPEHGRATPPSVEEVAARIAAAPPRGPGHPPRVDANPTGAAALAAFRATNVRPQRQPGYSLVTASVPQGDLTAGQLEVLAELVTAYGDGSARLTSAGAVQLRWICDDDVPALFERLAAAGLGRDGAGTPGDVLSCPGSEACRLAVTHTRGVARLVEHRIREVGGAAASTPLSIRISGCPNGCSQHHVAAIGLQGSARKVGSRAAPQYFVTVGGGVDEDGARFGKLAGKVPARRVPLAIERLVAVYLAERVGSETASAFFTRAADRAAAAIADLKELRSDDAVAEDFVEPGLDVPFAPQTQEGECAA